MMQNVDGGQHLQIRLPVKFPKSYSRQLNKIALSRDADSCIFKDNKQSTE